MKYRQILIAIAETVGLFVSGFVIPVLGQVLVLFTPVPLIIVTLRINRAAGLATLTASCVVVGLIGGPQAAALLLVSFGLMAIGASEGMRRQWKPERTVLLGGLLPLIVFSLGLAMYFLRIGKDPVAIAEVYLRGSVTEAAKFYTSIGLTDMSAMVSAVSDSFIHYLVRLLPGIIVAITISQAAFCYSFARAAIIRRPDGATLSSQTPLSLWHAPDSWVWGLIVALALIAAPSEASRLTGWNLAILYALVYLAQGAALIEHYLGKTRMHGVIRGLFIVLLLALPPAIAVVIALGIVDIWADFRKVRMPVLKI